MKNLVTLLSGLALLFAAQSSANTIHESNFTDPVISIAQITNVDCNGASTGAILLDVQGGVPPYSFNWSNGGSTNPLTVIPANTYSVTVMDDAGGMAVLQEISVTEPSAITVTSDIVDPACFGQNGDVTFTVSGGTPIYDQYYVSKFGTDPLVLRAMPFLFSATAGSHTATIRDANGCEITYDYSVAEAPQIVFSASANDVSCFGGNDGSINFTAAGGSGQLEFSIDNGATFSQNPVFQGLMPGYYQLVVRDANSCVTPEQPINVNQPLTPLNASAYGTPTFLFWGK